MGKVLCSSDWHGCGEVANKVLDFLKPDDELYYLGDITDRGKDGIQLLDRIMTMPNVHYILGNHDDMMMRSIPEIIQDIKTLGQINYANGISYPIWFGNGGNVTYEHGLKGKTIANVRKYLDYLKECPTKMTYSSPKGHKVILEHAGYSPFDIPHRHHDPLWDRDHFYDRWSAYEEDEEIKNTYLVHGHTPVQYLKYHYGYIDMPAFTAEDYIEKRQSLQNIFKEGEKYIKPTVLRYCEGHKLDVDMCTVFSGRIALLDLDTFETIYFDKEQED